MVEIEKEYGSKGATGAALGLGIAGTALGLLQNGNLGGILGGGCNSYVSKSESAVAARVAELETEVKLRDANVFTMGEMNKLRNYVDSKFDGINAQLCNQAVYNATNTATLNCIQGQVAQLMGLTKLVVPNGSICPGWGDVTVSVTPTT